LKTISSNGYVAQSMILSPDSLLTILAVFRGTAGIFIDIEFGFRYWFHRLPDAFSR